MFKRALIIIAAAFFMSAYLHGETKLQTNTDLEKDGLKGKVKSVVKLDSKVESVSGKINEVPGKKEIKKYDINGFLTEVSSYDEDGSHKESVNYILDNAGNVIESHETYRGKPYNSTLYEYNKKGELEEKLIKYSDGSRAYRIIYEYDNQGRRIRHEEKKKGFIFWSGSDYDTYKYDDHNNLIENVKYHNGSFLSGHSYKYDAGNNMIEHQFGMDIGNIDYGGKSKKGSREIRSSVQSIIYDDKGRKIQQRNHTSGEPRDIFDRYTYDKNGTLLKIEHFKEIKEITDKAMGVLESSDEFIYDKSGNMSRVNYYEYEQGRKPDKKDKVLKKITTWSYEYY